MQRQELFVSTAFLGLVVFTDVKQSSVIKGFSPDFLGAVRKVHSGTYSLDQGYNQGPDPFLYKFVWLCLESMELYGSTPAADCPTGARLRVNQGALN